jgi:DNA-binding MarR family transcriptional regulator
MKTDSLTFLFSSFTTKFKDVLEKQMSAIGLHSGQVFILNSLWQNDGQSQAELVKNLRVSAPTVYNMVIKMANSGFVKIRKDEFDSRIMRVFLTQKGREMEALVEIQCQKFEEQIFSILTETEKMMCTLIMQRLVSNIMPN